MNFLRPSIKILYYLTFVVNFRSISKYNHKINRTKGYLSNRSKKIANKTEQLVLNGTAYNT